MSLLSLGPWIRPNDPTIARRRPSGRRTRRTAQNTTTTTITCQTGQQGCCCCLGDVYCTKAFLLFSLAFLFSASGGGCRVHKCDDTALLVVPDLSAASQTHEENRKTVGRWEGERGKNELPYGETERSIWMGVHLLWRCCSVGRNLPRTVEHKHLFTWKGVRWRWNGQAWIVREGKLPGFCA